MSKLVLILSGITQVGKTSVRFPIRLFDIFALSNPHSRTITLGLAKILAQMSTMISLGGRKGKPLPVHKTDNLTAIFEPTVEKI
jgi:hypothetical protein